MTVKKATRNKQAEADMREIADLIDHATEPDKMKPEEALEFLGELRSELAMRMETLREENDL